MKPIQQPTKSAKLIRKGAIPVAFMLALTGPLASHTLERWEGNIERVYADRLANNIPTFCAGRTDWTAKVGTPLTSDFCEEVNKTTLLEYGFAVLECTEWKQLTASRLTGLTIFAINVGKAGACDSTAVKKINAGDIWGGCNAIAYKPSGAPNWSLAGGKYVPGLHNRRRAELDLCLRGAT